MANFITSDLHFGHGNIIKFCPDTRKQFLAPQGNPDQLLATLNDPEANFAVKQHILQQAVQFMDEELIRMWNETVSPADTTYILGDVAFCQASKAVQILRRLNGRIVLIKGNHDGKNLKDVMFQRCFDSIHDYLEIDHNGHKLCMFHYPIQEWNRCHRGSIHLYGHLHQNDSGLEQWRARNVGFDYTGRVVSSLDVIIDDALISDFKKHGDGNEV